MNHKTLDFRLLGDTPGNTLEGSDGIYSETRIFGMVSLLSLARGFERDRMGGHALHRPAGLVTGLHVHVFFHWAGPIINRSL